MSSLPSDGLAREYTPPKKPPVSPTRQRRPVPEYYDGRKPDEDGSQSSQASYVRADGKRVRRVKRSAEKKNIQSAPATIEHDSFAGMQQPYASEGMLDFILVGGILNENDSADTSDGLGSRGDFGHMPDEHLRSNDDFRQATLLKSHRTSEQKSMKTPGLLDSSTATQKDSNTETPKEVESSSAQKPVISVTSHNSHKTDEYEPRPAIGRNYTQNLKSSDDSRQETLLRSNRTNEKTIIKKPGLVDSSAATTQKEEKAVTPKEAESSSDQKTVTSLTSNNPHKTDGYELRHATDPYASLIDAAQKAVDALSRRSSPKHVKSVSAPTTEKERSVNPCLVQVKNLYDPKTEKETTVNPWLVDPDDLLEQVDNEEVGANPSEEFVTVNPSNFAPQKPDPDGPMPSSATSSFCSSPAPDQLIPSPEISPSTGPILDPYIPPPAIESALHEFAEAPQTKRREDQVFDNAVEKMVLPSPEISPSTGPILDRYIPPPAIETALHELAEAPQTKRREDQVFDNAVEKMVIPSREISPSTGPILDRYIPPSAIETAWHKLAEAPKTKGREDQVFDNAVEKMAASVELALHQGNAGNPSPPAAQLSADTSDCATLKELPSTDAVKQNREKEVYQPKEHVQTPKRRILPDFVGERTRSCATVDSYLPQTPVPVERKGGPSHVISPFNNDGDYDAYILQTAYARKRVKVVQLLIFGLLGLAFGFLSSFYVQSSCRFLTAHVEIGNGEELHVHYGMWKYTPFSSAFQGNSFCYKYDSRYSTGAPHIARIVGLVALLCGAYSLAVLWVYLVLGKTTHSCWNRAIHASLIAGVFQALTMLFFAGQVCLKNKCSVGPGAAVSIVSTLTWFVLAFEMHYNSPLVDHLSNQVKETLSREEDSIVASLEMSDVEHGVAAFFRRLQPRQELLTLNQYRRDATPRAHSPRPDRAFSPRSFSPGGLGSGRQESHARKEYSYEPPDFEAA